MDKLRLIPTIAPGVEHLTVFQRTPIWCLPKPDRALSDRERWLLLHIPGARLATRLLSQVFVELNFPLAAHFYGIVPLVGGLVGGSKTAYRYLPNSLTNFPDAGGLADRFRQAGFSDVRTIRLGFGAIALHVGTA